MLPPLLLIPRKTRSRNTSLDSAARRPKFASFPSRPTAASLSITTVMVSRMESGWISDCPFKLRGIFCRINLAIARDTHYLEGFIRRSADAYAGDDMIFRRRHLFDEQANFRDDIGAASLQIRIVMRQWSIL